MFRLKAIAYAKSRKVVFDDCSDHEQFTRTVAVISKEITKWIKRLRKNTGSPLRYLIVVEKHKSGDPHFHLLIHEVDEDQPVLHRHLNQLWTYGFDHFKLVEGDKAANYVCKYLSKSLLARVRASKRYGAYNDLIIIETGGKRDAMTLKQLTRNSVF